MRHGAVEMDSAPPATMTSASPASIERQAASMAEDLASFTGAELDQAYLDGQIILDAELLDDIQAIVIPSTSNTRYRTYLFELRDLLFSNLQAGRELDEPATGGTVVAP